MDDARPVFDFSAEDEADPPADLFGEADPSKRFADPDARRRAFEAWKASGGGIDRLPAGLLGAICGAALGQGRGR